VTAPRDCHSLATSPENGSIERRIDRCTDSPSDTLEGAPLAPAAAKTARIWIGDTPPSLNVVAGRRWDWVKAKRRWQTDLGVLLMAEQLPRHLHRVEASAVLTFPTRRRRDEGNFRSLLEKSLGDALVEGGWLDDDTPDRYRFGVVTFAEGAARTTIALRCLRSAE
jgi:hypothetical protein